MSRSWLNLVLLMLLVALVALVYFEPGLEKSEDIILTSLKPDQVNAFALEREGRETLQFQRQNKHWQLIAPIEVVANGARVQQLLEVLAATSLQRYPLAELDLSKYGLAPPRLRLQANGLVIGLGRSESLQMRRYVLVGQQMHLIPPMDTLLMNAALTTFVSARLLPEDVEISVLSIPMLGSVRRQQAGWQYQGEFQPPSADALQKLIDDWRYAAAIRVELSELLPETEGEPIKLQFSDNSEIAFRLLRREGELIFIRDDIGLAYQLARSQVARLLQWSDIGTDAVIEN